MAKYAVNTTVSVANSRSEIEKLLTRYGVVERAFVDGVGKASIQFKSNERMVRFVLTLPVSNDPQFARTPKTHMLRSPEARAEAWEQACRQRWRALCLSIKAKLEAVECQIATFDEEFLAYVVMPDGKTVAEHTVPRIAEAYKSNTTPPLLGFAG